jgi:hypothetical protein
MRIFLSTSLIFLLLLFETHADPLPHAAMKQGQILFLAQQGSHEQALKLYQEMAREGGQHDFDLLHQIALQILEDGFRQKDPECQLLALFGASVSANEEAYHILEESLKSKYPEIQLIALQALARFQNDRADLALIRALGADAAQVRIESAHQLCKKRHPQAVGQTESLMYKSPSEFWPIYPPLFAMVGDAFHKDLAQAPGPPLPSRPAFCHLEHQQVQKRRSAPSSPKPSGASPIRPAGGMR